jgi:RNA polymerase sigma-70 factor (ECF subfamily)
MDYQKSPEFKTIKETDLINRIRKGETELFEIIIRRFNPYLYKTGRSYGYGHPDVEDLMQEAFIAAYLNLGKFEGRSSFKTWITRIMLNLCNRKFQKLSFQNEKPKEVFYDETQIPVFQDKSSFDINKTLMNKELRHVVEKALLKIPVDYRLVFSLRELNDMNTSETAEALNISEANVKVRLNRAKLMLRETIENMYERKDIFEFNLIYCDGIVNKVMKIINDLPDHGNHYNSSFVN